MNTFEGKYNCLPGDCANATAFFSGAVNGNGNGLIGNFPFAEMQEMSQAWYQLAQAQLISGNYTGQLINAMPLNCPYRSMVPGTNAPLSTFGNSTGYTLVYWPGWTDVNDWSPPVYGKINSHVLMFGQGKTGCESYEPAISPLDASAIDAKIDDGLPGTGRVIFLLPTLFAGCVSTTNPQTSQYQTSGNNSNSQTCSLVFSNLF